MVAGGFVASSGGADVYDDATRWRGIARVAGPAWAQMPLSTVGMVGLSIVWSVEMSNAPSYLLTLGMSRAGMSVVFLAGPLSGLIVQPLVGALADASTSKFGRRRPYIFGGALLCAIAMLLLGFTRAVAGWVTGSGTTSNASLTIALAVIAIYCIDFSVNAVQAADRAILVDVWPREDQERGNAWAARMSGVGSIAGFFVGNVDVTQTLPFLGNTQIQILSAISAITLVGFHAATCWAVKERVQLTTPSDSKSGKKSSKNPIKTLLRDVRALPKTIRDICVIQFFVWIAWFPIMFYTSVYVGDIYKRAEAPPVSALWTVQMIEDEATRLGSRALFYNALVSFAGTLLLPFCILESRDIGKDDAVHGRSWISAGASRWRKPTLAEMWTGSHLLFSICMAATWWISSVWAAQTMMAVLGLCSAMGAWAPFSLLGQAILSEPDPSPEDENDIALADRRTRAAARRVENGTYESVPAEVEDDRTNGNGHPSAPGLHARKSFDSAAGSDFGSDEDDFKPSHGARGGSLASLGTNPLAQVSHASIALSSPVVRQGVDDDDEEVGHTYHTERRKTASIGDKGGSILGIHNVFVVIPQFVASGLSSLIFAIFEPEKTTPHPGVADVPSKAFSNDTIANPFLDGRGLGTERWRRQEADTGVTLAGSDAMGIIFRIGGVSSLIACALCWRLAKYLRRRG